MWSSANCHYVVEHNAGKETQDNTCNSRKLPGILQADVVQLLAALEFVPWSRLQKPQLGFRSSSFPASARCSHLGRVEEDREQDGDTALRELAVQRSPVRGWVRTLRLGGSRTEVSQTSQDLLDTPSLAVPSDSATGSHDPGPTGGAVSSASKWQNRKQNRATPSQPF